MTAAVDEQTEIEVRCPVPHQLPDGHCRPGKLLFKLQVSGGRPSFVQPDNLIELSCEDCRYRLRQRGSRVKRVLHRFDLAGNLVATLTDGEVIAG
jgi:hypothetical protein